MRPTQWSTAGQHGVRIYILGVLQVRRADGSTADPREWRTAKTADLLRMLALHADRPVDPQLLLDTLWPEVEPSHARASLRTAAYQIRHVLGAGVLEREPSGLRLCHVWVDVDAFKVLVNEIRVLAELQRWPKVLSPAGEAIGLYRGELSTAASAAEWASAERRSLACAYQGLLVDAAEAALHCGRPRDAIHFATRAIESDPFDERATRQLMQAHLDLGQLPAALREYHRCRALLAIELGIDPSPQTSNLYLTALRE